MCNIVKIDVDWRRKEYRKNRGDLNFNETRKQESSCFRKGKRRQESTENRKSHSIYAALIEGPMPDV